MGHYIQYLYNQPTFAIQQQQQKLIIVPIKKFNHLAEFCDWLFKTWDWSVETWDWSVDTCDWSVEI